MSLLGYFWLLNGLNFLDGFLTVMGIEMGILYEWNPAVRFLIEKFGLHGGIFIAKASAFVLISALYKRHVPGSNFVRNVYFALIGLYGYLFFHTTFIILRASNV